MERKETFAEYLKKSLIKNAALVYVFTIFSWVLTVVVLSFFKKKEILQNTLNSHSEIFARAISSGDWELIVTLNKGLNSSYGIYNLKTEKIGYIYSSPEKGFFPYCTHSFTTSITSESLSGCVNVYNFSEILMFLFLIAVVIVLFYFQMKRINKATHEISDFFKMILNNTEASISELKIRNTDLFRFEETIGLQKVIQNTINNSIDQKIEIKIRQVAAQVSHDIRSPLSALEMISSQLNEVQEHKRLLLRNAVFRIRDIANSLVLKNNELNNFNDSLQGQKLPILDYELLMPILDSIVTEKRLQFRDQLGIQIEFNQTVESYGLFSKINITEFKRVLSNIINNSIEAFQGDQGLVFVELTSVGHDNIIRIQDNGKGIPDHLLERLGVRGATFNKEGGSGLGLYHAKSTVESWGGRLEISSKVGHGTEIKIFIPKQDTPSWFVPKLQFKKMTTVVVFDDDQTIHQIWTDKLVSAGLNSAHLLHLSTPSELRDYCSHQNPNSNEVLYLMDYEILNHRETGLDMIEELKIQSKSILVTSRYEEITVRERCDALGVQFIPKSMSGFVPIQLVD